MELVELKTALNRHARDLDTFMVSRNKRLDVAMNQVTQQGLCLFSSPKFSFQNEVFLIVGTGEWWSFTMMNRRQASRWIKVAHSSHSV